jgi:small-conductance mechanosensitive channel
MFSHLGLFEILLLIGIPCMSLLVLGGVIALVIILVRKNRNP